MSSNIGCQTIYSAGGVPLFEGGWDSHGLYRAVTGDLTDEYWRGRRVLDIGANTCGLSVEIARRGASVVAAEPDPLSLRAKGIDVLRRVIEEEGLSLELRDEGIFAAHTLGKFDTVLCLGLVYHFRDQQFVLDYLSTLETTDLIISNQTAAGDGYVMYNRLDPSIPVPKDFWKHFKGSLSGWHPTRPLFERMLNEAGFDDVRPLTDPSVNYPQKPYPGCTNSSYFIATKRRQTDPLGSRYVYLPR